MSTKAQIRQEKERGFFHGICGLEKRPRRYSSQYLDAYALGERIGGGRHWLSKAARVHDEQDYLHRMLSRKGYVKSKREPCHLCHWAALCKVTERTCEAFRAYCGEFVNRDNPSRVPDLHWYESWDIRTKQIQ